MVTSIHKLLVRIMPLTIVLAVLFTFRNLTYTFFQQDEWQYFGSSIYAILSSNPIANILLPLQGQITHFFPFATAMFLGEYILFKMNFSYYVLVNLFLHSANAVLMYFLISLLTRKKFPAWGSALLFSVNSLAHQPITWVAAGMGTLPGTFFLLLFFLCLVRFNQTKRRVMLVFGFLSLLTSILFKETSIFVFLFLPLMWFAAKIIYHHSLKVPRVALLSFVALGVSYALLRIFFLITPVRSAQPEVGDVTTASAVTYVFRFITIPLKAFPQSIIPFPVLRLVSGGLVHLAYPQFIASDGAANPYIVESILFDLTCFLGSAFLVFLSFVAYRVLKKSEPTLAKLLLASVLFIGTSALPYIFVPGRAGFFSIFAPRDLYVVSIGASVWIMLLLYALRKRLMFFLVIVLLFVFHSVSIQQDITKLVEVGQIRKHFLTTMKQAYPKLPQNVVFFTQSDRSYYGLAKEEKVLPIQSGFGRMLMVWYQDTEYFPGCLYENAFLHGIKVEGYRNCGGRGVGYFRQYASFLSGLRENKLPPDVVIAYNWNSKKDEFSDITSDIRARLRRDVPYEPRQ